MNRSVDIRDQRQTCLYWQDMSMFTVRWDPVDCWRFTDAAKVWCGTPRGYRHTNTVCH